MTKKRYRYIYNDDGSEMIEHQGDYITNMEEATDELNKQNEKIQELDKRIQRQAQTIQEYYTLMQNKDYQSIEQLIAKDKKEAEYQEKYGA